MAERRKNDWIENKRSRGLHIRLGTLFKRVVLGRIRCFCFSQAARDVQEVQETTNSPLCARMGYKPLTICHMLREEGLTVNQMGIHKLLQKHRVTNNIERRPGSGRPTKMTAPVKALVEQQTRDDDETTAVQLHALLLCHGHTRTVLRCRGALGWMLRGSAYCQLIRQQNKVKRLQVVPEKVVPFSIRFVKTVRKRYIVSYCI